MVGAAILPPETVHPVPQVLSVICTSPGAEVRPGQVEQTVTVAITVVEHPTGTSVTVITTEPGAAFTSRNVVAEP